MRHDVRNQCLIVLPAAQRKVAVHCLTEKPDYELGHCYALEEEIRQYKTQVHPEIAATADLQSQLDAAKAKVAACGTGCSTLISKVDALTKQVDAARIAENKVLAASQSGTDPLESDSETPDSGKPDSDGGKSAADQETSAIGVSTGGVNAASSGTNTPNPSAAACIDGICPTTKGKGNLPGIVVGVVGCVLGLAVAMGFALRSSKTATTTAVVVQQRRDVFDNPNYDPNAEGPYVSPLHDPQVAVENEGAYEEVENTSNTAGYMDVAPNSDMDI